MEPTDPLAHPVRRRAFELLSDLRRPARIEEIAAHLGRHPSGVRTHLARLEEAELVTCRRVPVARGRPRYEWAIAPGATPHGRPPDRYAELAGWLAGALATGAADLPALAEHGRTVGRALAPEPTPQPQTALADVFSAMGFQPATTSGGDRTTYELCNCPYRAAVHSGGRHVCALHEGITRGLLDRIAPGASLEGFVAKDPDQAGCLVEIVGLNADEGQAKRSARSG